MTEIQQRNRASSLTVVTILGTFMVLLSFTAGIVGGFLGNWVGDQTVTTDSTNSTAQIEIVHEDSPIITVAEQASPAVVSIVATKDQIGIEQIRIGAGTGFIVSEDGLIISNKHVVADERANYTVILNDGTQLTAEVLGRDLILDIAVLKVVHTEALTTLNLGDSDSIRVGQNVIAIGNSLGQFSNTVSAGIVSGLARSIIASDSDGRNAERLEGVIQTDASINPGNSGGPLLDIRGNVVGVNVAVAQEAENVGFAIPINSVKPVIKSIQEFGEIRRALLGVQYLMVTPKVAEDEGLSVNYGALLVSGEDGTGAVVPDSAAEKAGLQEDDIILEINGTKLDHKTSLQAEILKYNVGDEVSIRYLRNDAELTIQVILTAL
jgi:serine protease Do